MALGGWAASVDLVASFLTNWPRAGHVPLTTYEA